MAGNLLQVGSDNAVRVKSDGLVVAGASDPCCCALKCSYCTGGDIPNVIRVVLSGIIPCGTAADINGTYDITLSTCYTIYDTGITIGYLGTVGKFYIFVQIVSATIFQLKVGDQEAGMFGGTYTAFNNSSTSISGANCRNNFDGVTYNNSQTSCVGNFPTGYNGTATVTILS